MNNPVNNDFQIVITLGTLNQIQSMIVCWSPLAPYSTWYQLLPLPPPKIGENFQIFVIFWCCVAPLISVIGKNVTLVFLLEIKSSSSFNNNILLKLKNNC